MTAESSKQPTAGDGAPPSYGPRNPARRAMGVGLIKPALDSTNDLVGTIRRSTTDRPEYIELERSCVGVREVLNRGTNRRQEDPLSQSGLEAIEELIATTNEIKRNILKQGKRWVISRALHSKRHKQAIVSWRLSLNKILCTLSGEFESCEPVFTPDPRHEAAEPPTATPDVNPGNSNTENISPTAPHDTSDSRTTASQVPTKVDNIHALDHETHRNATESIDGGRNPGRSTHVRSMPPPRNASGMPPDICPRIGEMDTIADTHEVINGMSQINKGTSGRHQVVAESVPGESPPPPQRIFGRDEFVNNIVDLVDTDHPTPIALIGTGGIGKTSVALAVLHDDRTKRRFGDHRRLLRCDQFPASLPNFLRRLSEVIGAGIPNPADLTSLRPFLSRNMMLIIIDNAESIFGGPTTEDIELVVEELSQFRNIWLCITSRTSIIPTHCKVIDVPMLSMEAAREAFHNIYRRDERSNAVDDILKQLDFHPLSITLLATAAKHNKWGIDQLEKEWEEQRTGVLRTRYHGSLAAAIELSLRSPMFRDLGPHARELLGVVAFFPRGVDESNLDWLFPSITDRKKIFDGFRVLSLTHRDRGFITMLAPLRDHLRPKDPMSASLLCSVREHYFGRLLFSIKTVAYDGGTTWIASEDINVEHLLDIFTSIDVNSESVWDACGHFMVHLFFQKPRFPVFGRKIEALPDDYPSKLQCLVELSNLYFAVANFAEYRRLLRHALKLYRERGDGHQIAFALRQLAAISSSPDLCEEGIQQAREALAIYQRLGDLMGVVDCHTQLSSLFRLVNRLDDAEKCESQAFGLIDALMPVADPMSRGLLHASLCNIYSGRGDTEKVISHHEASLGAMPGRGCRFQVHLGLATNHFVEGRLDDAETHLEHAESLAANGSFELQPVILLRASILREHGKFEEARTKALCALDLAEQFGGGDEVEEAKDILYLIEKDMVEWPSMSELLAPLIRSTGATTRAAHGGKISQDEKIHKAAKKLVALLEKDDNRPGGPNFFQTRKAYRELAALTLPSDDEEVNEAIAESLTIPTAMDEPEEMPSPGVLTHQDNGPVVIWTTDPKFAHIGQLWQALYHVPQVRHRISLYRSPHPPKGDTKVDVDLLSSGTAGHVSSAHELFRHMELSGLAVVTDKSLMERLPHQPWEGISPCEDVQNAYEEFSERVEINLNDELATRGPDWPRLFHSRISGAMSQERSAFDAKKDFSLISLGYNDGDESSDLMGCLASQVFPEPPEQRLFDPDHTTTGGCKTMEAADVIAFALERDESPPSPVDGRSQQRRKFSFPESFRLDQFVTTSRARVQGTKVAEGGILREAGSGPARPNANETQLQWPSKRLSVLQNEDVTKGTPLSLHHCENVANPPTDAGRHPIIDRFVAKLEDGIAHTEAEQRPIGTTMEQPREESQDSPSSELAQENKYDLRAVLMYDGHTGRKNMYSYINHIETWWKVIDSTVTQVTLETVLSDENGMDIGAEPFLLIYSRSLPGPLKSEWPEALIVSRSVQGATYNHNAVGAD